MKGTNLQEVFDAFFIKVPSIDFSEKENQVIQFLKSAIAHCHKHTYDNLEYFYDEDLENGYFYNTISIDSIELISMFMTIDCFQQRFSLINMRRQYLGTNAFNKIPSNKEDFENTKNSLDYWRNRIDRYLMEFPEYSDER